MGPRLGGERAPPSGSGAGCCVNSPSAHCWLIKSSRPAVKQGWLTRARLGMVQEHRGHTWFLRVREAWVWSRCMGALKVCVLVIQSCLTLCDPMGCHLPGSSEVHGILQARILKWVVIPFSRASSWPRDQTQVFCTADGFFTICVTREAWDHSVQFSHSVVSDSLRPHGLQHARPPVHHQLPELTQTHVYRVGDAIQPSHPLSSLSSPAFNLSQQKGLFKWIGSSHQLSKVLEYQLQHQSSSLQTGINWATWNEEMTFFLGSGRMGLV